MKSVTKPTFCLVDPCLRDFVGHYFEYDHSLVTPVQNRGYRALVLGHKEVVPEIAELLPVEKVFATGFWNSDRRLSTIFRYNYSFYRELRAGIGRARLSPDSMIFTHMITDSQLLAWAWYVRSLPAKHAPQIILLLRYQVSFYENRHSAFAFRLLERAARNRRVRLATDSERLAQSYGRVTSLPVEVFPIPHTAHTMAGSPSAVRGNARPLRLVSLGNARDEKGFLEVLGAIRVLHRSNMLAGLEFALQCNDAPPEIRTAISDFLTEHIPNTRLITEALDTEEYYALLHSADGVLLPYWRSIYEARTSGIFLEAVAAGKPVIVAENTWMSDQLQRFDSGVTCRDRDAADLARAIIELARNHERLTQRAREARTECIRVHNPDTFVAALEGVARRVKAARHRRAAVFYPWGDILERRAGASVRCHLLIEFLKEHLEEIRVLQPGLHPDMRRRNVRLEFYKSPSVFQMRAERVYHFLIALVTLGRSRGQDHMLWYHIAPRLDRHFKRRVLELIRWADIVFLEYTFWSGVVASACRKYGVPIILTDYDIVAEQVTESRWLRQLTRTAELRALRDADYVVCVSNEDQETLRRRGVAAEVVPHPVNVGGLDLPVPDDFAVTLLEQLYDVVLPAKRFCFFVGSGFPPNVIAVESIRKIARRLAAVGAAEDEIGFVVAGGCAAPERSGNFVALGKLDDIALRAVYRLAELILIPLPFGTGASIKTIEAMATAKPVLGTTTAFRGFPVTSGVQCVISDDLESYPELILEILRSPERARTLSRSARQFAEAYDYRRVYLRYLELAGFEASHESPAKSDPARPEFQPLLREIVRRAVDREKPAIAMPFLSQWLRQNPGDGEAHYLLARSLDISGENSERALEHYARALAEGFDEFSIRLQRVRLLRKMQEFEVANAEMRLAVASKVETVRTPSDLDGIKRVVWGLFHAAEYDDVVALVRPLLAKHPQNGELHYLVAQSWHNSGRADGEVVEHYTRALECGFDEFWVRFNRGRLLRELGQAEASRADLARAAALRPDDPAVRDLVFNETKARIWEMFHASKYDEALKLVRPLLAKHPQNGELHYLVAQSWHNSGRAGGEVVEHYTRALECGFGVLPQDEFWVRFHRGRFLWEARRTEAARVDIERAVALRPTDPMARRLLGEINENVDTQ